MRSMRLSWLLIAASASVTACAAGPQVSAVRSVNIAPPASLIARATLDPSTDLDDFEILQKVFEIDDGGNVTDIFCTSWEKVDQELMYGTVKDESIRANGTWSVSFDDFKDLADEVCARPGNGKDTPLGW